MEKLFKLSFVLVCILFTVSCKTVIEEEKVKETINFSGMDMEIKEIIYLSDSVRNLADSLTRKHVPILINKFFKEAISVFPNPTSNYVTIKISPQKQITPDGREIISTFDYFNFRYELMFDETIIYKSQIKSLSEDIWQEIIPEHLLNNSGMHFIIYEFINKKSGEVSAQGVLNFMVIKKQ